MQVDPTTLKREGVRRNVTNVKPDPSRASTKIEPDASSPRQSFFSKTRTSLTQSRTASSVISRRASLVLRSIGRKKCLLKKNFIH